MTNPLIKQLLTFSHFCIWSATKRSDFEQIQVTIRPLIEIYQDFDGQSLEIRLLMNKPSLDIFLPEFAVETYNREFKADFLYSFVPF